MSLGKSFQNTSQSIELVPVSTRTQAQDDSTTSFFSEIAVIQSLIFKLGNTIQQINSIHQRLLGPLTPNESSNEAEYLGNAKADVTRQSHVVKNRIQRLDLPVRGTSVGRVREQAMRVRQQFIANLEAYQSDQQLFLNDVLQRAERGYRFLNPSTSSEEIQEFLDGQRDAYPTTGSTSDYGTTRSAINDVQQRQVQLQETQATLAELAQLLSEMVILGDQQDRLFDSVPSGIGDVERGITRKSSRRTLDDSDKRRRRKKLWVAVGIVSAILAIFGLAIGLKYGLPSLRNTT